jgi:hypothetical protein
MIAVKPVLHLYEQEIDSQIIFTPGATVVKFHTACDVDELHALAKSRLTDAEHDIFLDLFANDSATRKFETKSGYLIIS